MFKLATASGNQTIDTKKSLPYWQYRIGLAIILGYATYYIVRLNFSIAMPKLMDVYGYSKTELGMALSIFSIVYGGGKFFLGLLCDVSSTKKFICIGLIGTAAINLMISFSFFSSSLIFLTLLWTLNGVFQSMGWPPCARLLTQWFSQKQIGTAWGICNSAHGIGSTFIAIIGSYLITHHSWQACFYIPAFIAIMCSVWLSKRLIDSPSEINISLNEKVVMRTDSEAESSNYKKLVFHHLLKNPIVWCMCMGNMFLYIVRLGIVNWIPTFLIEYKHCSLQMAGWQFAVFEIMGILGGIFAGWLSDKMKHGHRSKIAMIFLIGLFVCVVFIYAAPEESSFLFFISLVFCGFFIYGPQILGGVVATDYVSKKVAASTTGLIGTFGYIGASIAGVGIGSIADLNGWPGVFLFFMMCTLISFLCFFVAHLVSNKMGFKTLAQLNS